MAAEAWQAEAWQPGTNAADHRRVRPRRGRSEGRFGRWALAIGLAALAIFLTEGGYSASADSNRQVVFGLAFGVGLVVGGLLWFR